MRLYLLALLLFVQIITIAQTKIKGVVRNKADGLVMSGVSVTIRDKKSGNMINYALTDDKGWYHLIYSGSTDSLTITISGLNIEKQYKTLFNSSQEVNFTVNPQTIELKETKVNPPKIRRLSDTISYTVDGFKDKNDRTIGDVLKKLPGIEVKTDGSILYNNKPINKFYIENKDLLQGRYGIATNNIEAKDVSTVQVLENHQPVKALKNREFTDEAALNLTLKDSAKGVLSLSAKAGAGLSPALWNNELFSMYFNKSRQNINTYKGNNTGDDPGVDFNSHYTDPNRTDNSTALAVQAPSTPSINQKRYLFNRTHAFSINNLLAYGKETQVNVNINYLNDRQEKNSFSRSIYYLQADSMLKIEEKLSSADRINQLNASIQLNTNKANYYLNNQFSFNGQWNQTEGTVIRPDTIFQYLKKPLYAFSNNFNLIKNYKKTSIKINSYLAYTRSPQLLNVMPVLYGNLFNGITDPAAMRQGLLQTKFISNTSVSFGLNSQHLKQNYYLGVNANLQRFQSDLQEEAQTGVISPKTDSLSNSLKWNKAEMYFTPDYTYVYNHFRLQALLPISYTNFYTNDQLSGQSKNLNRLFLNPTVLINYDLSQFIALSANARYTNQLGELSDLFTSYLMQSYRNLVKNDGQLPEIKNQTYNIYLNYRHPIHQLFINLNSSYSRNHFNLLSSYAYQNILSVKTTYSIPNVTSASSVSAKISKGIDLINGTLSIYASYANNNGSQINQGKILDYQNEIYLIKPTIATKIKSWASFTYSFEFTQSKSNIIDDISNFAPIYSNTHLAQLNLFPLKRLTINLAHEYFYSSAISRGYRTMSFADTGIKYLYKNIEFGAAYNNIFNAKQYITASYINTNTYYYQYNLRPAQVLINVRFKII